MQRSLSPGSQESVPRSMIVVIMALSTRSCCSKKMMRLPCLLPPSSLIHWRPISFAVCFSCSWLASGERKLSANGKINSALCPKSSLVLASENCPERHFPSGPLFFWHRDQRKTREIRVWRELKTIYVRRAFGKSKTGLVVFSLSNVP